MDIENKLLEYFKNTGSTGIDITTRLVEQGIIDSMGVMELVAFIGNEFGVEFEIDDMTMENFSTITAITALVNSKVKGK